MNENGALNVEKIKYIEFIVDLFCEKWTQSAVLTDIKGLPLFVNDKYNPVSKHTVTTMGEDLQERFEMLIDIFHSVEEPTIIDGSLTLRPQITITPVNIHLNKYYLFTGHFIDQENSNLLEKTLDTSLKEVFKELPCISLNNQDKMLNDIGDLCVIISGFFPNTRIGDEISTTVPSFKEAKPNNPSNLLTLREEQIASLISLNRSNKEISKELNLSESTIKSHISNIFKKLNLRSRKQLINKVK